MKEFKSCRSYWDFKRSVLTERRYVHTAEVQRFLDAVLDTGRKRATMIPINSILWRSQLGTDELQNTYGEGDEQEVNWEEVALPPERMKPLKIGASEGRANPKGIPCLYLSDDKDTALAEVRPWVGSPVSIGQFKVIRDLKVIDFSEDDGKHLLFMGGEPGPEKREEAVWRDINRAFAAPVTPSDRHADYVPTQIIAELFISDGYDGIVFKSSCESGHNIALFDIDSAELLNGAPYSVKSIKFESEQNGNPYFVKSKQPKQEGL